MVKKKDPIVVFLEGPDGCGKTNISQRLSKDWGIPYFKAPTEKMNWKDGTFRDSIPFDMLLPHFVQQTNTDFISDRCYISEIVYSEVYGRNTAMDKLWEVDRLWGELGAVVVLALRRDYSVVTDELVDPSMMDRLHDGYLQFMDRTACGVVAIYVDDYFNNIEFQVPELRMNILGIMGRSSRKKRTMEVHSIP